MSKKESKEIIKPSMRPIASAVALALLSFMETAGAQQAAPAIAESPKLEEVVVTANKRIEVLEHVPMAISVLGDAVLQRNNVREIADVINLSPALSITYGTTPANNGINMRGIGTTSIGIGVEADVAVIIDDVPMGMQVRAFQDLTDISRIEILKGPQSTLFGKSAIAGAVNIVTKPISGPLSGTASTLYTSDGEWRVGTSYGGELSDKFGFRIAASDNRFAGNVNNLTTGTKVNGSGGKTFMAKLSWHPTDALDVDFSPRYNHSVTTCCALVLTSMTPLNGALLSN
ncbi:TonB-dependent receptor plug domain-containing protein, partial [Undibacterium sp.]|uniref:TonB-dependent receptor plug domain-containing protein n=1 Tax=Undibacterium sp. TaxID=1914977 RepID=UPI002C5B0C3C